MIGTGRSISQTVSTVDFTSRPGGDGSHMQKPHVAGPGTGFQSRSGQRVVTMKQSSACTCPPPLPLTA